MKMKFIWLDKKNHTKGFTVIEATSKKKCMISAEFLFENVILTNWYEI